MNESSNFWRSVLQVIEQNASSAKVGLTVSASSAAVSVAARQIDFFTDVVTKYTIAVGAVTTTVILAIHVIKMIRVWKAWQANAPEPEDLK